VNPALAIGYRNLTTNPIGSNLKATIAEFSISSALLHIQPLVELRQGNLHPELIRNALKTAAAISTISRRSQPYIKIAPRGVLSYSIDK
jgi:hypothetical protein